MLRSAETSTAPSSTNSDAQEATTSDAAPSASSSTRTATTDVTTTDTTPSNASAEPAQRSERIDADELEALKDREPRAVERWIYGHRDLIFHFLLKQVKNEDTARELLQETFYQALRSVPSFRGDSKVSTWLCSIARNLAYKHFREQDRYTTAESETLEYINHAGDDGASHSTFTGTPRSHTERTERKQMLYAAMNDLPDSYRQIIRLRDLEERSTKEVANELDLTRVNVRVRLHRARKRLKSLLAPQFPVGDRSMA